MNYFLDATLIKKESVCIRCICLCAVVLDTACVKLNYSLLTFTLGIQFGLSIS